MRYQARWSNGYWKTFDSYLFVDSDIHGLRTEAEKNAARMNLKTNSVKSAA